MLGKGHINLHSLHNFQLSGRPCRVTGSARGIQLPLANTRLGDRTQRSYPHCTSKPLELLNIAHRIVFKRPPTSTGREICQHAPLHRVGSALAALLIGLSPGIACAQIGDGFINPPILKASLVHSGAISGSKQGRAGTVLGSHLHAFDPALLADLSPSVGFAPAPALLTEADIAPENPEQQAREVRAQQFWSSLVQELRRQLGPEFQASLQVIRVKYPLAA